MAWASLLPLVLAVALGWSFIRSAAPTYDEAVHLASGYSYLATGRYRLNIMDHPPLAEMWAALPLLAWRPHLLSSTPDWELGRVYRYSDLFLNRNKVPGERMMNAGRLFCLLSWTLLIGGGVWAWSLSLGGRGAAFFSTLSFALTPALVSNLSLVTTDGASAAFFFLTFLLLSVEDRTKTVWAVSGACAGLALASKFNMAMLGPMVLVGVLAEHVLRPKPRPTFPYKGLFIFGLCAFLALAAVYRFGQFGLYWEGLRATWQRLGEGRSSYLHGHYSIEGSWTYFPIAFTIKTPLRSWGGVIAIILWVKGQGEGIAAGAGPRRRYLWVLYPMGAYFLAALTAKVQIGIRHLLPMMPFFVLASGWGLSRLWARGRAGAAACALLCVWAAASVLNARPFLLAYFNEAVGGPSNGRHWLADSNLDWGQDLKTLARDLAAEGSPPIYLSYFGTADPAAYGLHYVPVAFSANVERTGDAVDPSLSGRVLFAVSATNLQCVYFADKTLFDWLKTRAPLKAPGGSIFLYDLSSDAEGKRSLARLLALSGRDPGLFGKRLLE